MFRGFLWLSICVCVACGKAEVSVSIQKRAEETSDIEMAPARSSGKVHAWLLAPFDLGAFMAKHPSSMGQRCTEDGYAVPDTLGFCYRYTMLEGVAPFSVQLDVFLEGLTRYEYNTQSQVLLGLYAYAPLEALGALDLVGQHRKTVEEKYGAGDYATREYMLYKTQQIYLFIFYIEEVVHSIRYIRANKDYAVEQAYTRINPLGLTTLPVDAEFYY